MKADKKMADTPAYSSPDDLRKLIRNVPDFPKPGIVFRDITPLLSDANGLALAIKLMAKPFADMNIEAVVGAESRGFIFGLGLALELGCGFVPVRKKGKLPAAVISQEYSLEYGTDKLEIHSDAVNKGQRVLLVDDLLATGGTMQACCELLERLEAKILGISFLIELSFLNGRNLLGDYNIHNIISYDSE